MSPEYFNLLRNTQDVIIAVMEDLSIYNYGSASIKLRQLYANLAVQSSLLNANLDEMESVETRVINCIPSDEEIERELNGCE